MPRRMCGGSLLRQRRHKRVSESLVEIAAGTLPLLRKLGDLFFRELHRLKLILYATATDGVMFGDRIRARTEESTMGERVRIPLERSHLQRLLRPAARPGRRGDSGVVGTRAAHRGPRRALREGRLRGDRARSLPRQDHDLARRSRQDADGARRRARRERDRRRGRVPPPASRVHVEEIRRRRLLHGRRARAVRGDVRREERRRGGQLLRRLQEGQSRLGEARRRRSSSSTARTTRACRPRADASSNRNCGSSARTWKSWSIRTPTTRSSTTRVPRCTTPRRRRTRGGARSICSGALCDSSPRLA